MLALKMKEEMKRRNEIVNNPLKMRDIYKEIEGKSKKEKKERKHKRDRSNSAERRKHKKKSSRRQDSASRSRSKSKSQERCHKDRKEVKRYKSNSSKDLFNEYLKKKLGPNEEEEEGFSNVL